MDNGTRDACPCCKPTFGIQSDKYGGLQEHRCREERQMALSAGSNRKMRLPQQILAALKDRWNTIKAAPPCNWLCSVPSRGGGGWKMPQEDNAEVVKGHARRGCPPCLLSEKILIIPVSLLILIIY